VADLEAVVVHRARQPARAFKLAVGGDVAVDEAVLVDGRAGVVGAGDAVIQHPAALLQLAVEELEVAGDIGLADVLGDADRADRVEVGLGDIAVVHVADLGQVLKAFALDGRLRPGRLLRGQGYAERLDALVLGSVPDHAAPAAADVEQAHARLEGDLAGDQVVLV